MAASDAKVEPGHATAAPLALGKDAIPAGNKVDAGQVTVGLPKEVPSSDAKGETGQVAAALPALGKDAIPAGNKVDAGQVTGGLPAAAKEVPSSDAKGDTGQVTAAPPALGKDAIPAGNKVDAGQVTAALPKEVPSSDAKGDTGQVTAAPPALGKDAIPAGNKVDAGQVTAGLPPRRQGRHGPSRRGAPRAYEGRDPGGNKVDWPSHRGAPRRCRPATPRALAPRSPRWEGRDPGRQQGRRRPSHRGASPQEVPSSDAKGDTGQVAAAPPAPGKDAIPAGNKVDAGQVTGGLPAAAKEVVDGGTKVEPGHATAVPSAFGKDAIPASKVDQGEAAMGLPATAKDGIAGGDKVDSGQATAGLPGSTKDAALVTTIKADPTHVVPEVPGPSKDTQSTSIEVVTVGDASDRTLLFRFEKDEWSLAKVATDGHLLVAATDLSTETAAHLHADPALGHDLLHHGPAHISSVPDIALSAATLDLLWL